MTLKPFHVAWSSLSQGAKCCCRRGIAQWDQEMPNGFGASGRLPGCKPHNKPEGKRKVGSTSRWIQCLLKVTGGSQTPKGTTLLAGADPDIGLSYAWDRLLLSGAVVYRLHAGCLWSEENFRRLAGRLEAVVWPHQRVACRCGGSCRELATASE